MAKGANDKLKLNYLMKMFLEKTDDSHSITMPEVLYNEIGKGKI